jgi:hypothetical protein
MLGICDVWRDMLIDFFSPSRKRYDYDRFLGLAKSPPHAEREILDGEECVRVSMECADDGFDLSYTFWHDVRRNYLIRKEVATFRKGDESSHCDYEILEFRQAKPEIVVPLSRRLRAYEKGQLRQEELTTLSDVRVNEPIAEDVFTLPPVPAGTVVHDHIDWTQYPIDTNWKPVGPKRPFQMGRAGVSPAGGGSGYQDPTAGLPTPAAPAPTEREPSPGTRWLLPAMVIVLAGVGTGWAYRRWQSREQSAARR